MKAHKQPKNSRKADHLKPHQWPKGYCPNPGGRPKGRTLLTVIREMLSTPHGDEKELEAVAKAFVEAMKGGSFQHAKEYIEREEGKMPEDAHVRVVIEYSDTDPRNPADVEAPARGAASRN